MVMVSFGIVVGVSADLVAVAVFLPAIFLVLVVVIVEFGVSIFRVATVVYFFPVALTFVISSILSPLSLVFLVAIFLLVVLLVSLVLLLVFVLAATAST